MTHTPDTATITTHDGRIRPLTDHQLKQLMTDLNEARVQKLDKGRTSLSYLAAWDIKATLIRVFGFGGFSAEADLCDIVRIENDVPKTKGYGKEKVELPVERNPDGTVKFGTANFRVTVRLRVKLTIHQLDAVYTEWAAASQTGPDLGEVTDFAIKTAESDALKRAAIYLGTQFGLSLYDNGATRDVIKAILAPGQEWRRGERIDPATGMPVAAPQQQPGAPATASGSVTHLRGEGMTDEQHAAAAAQLDSALTAKKSQREQAAMQQDVAGEIRDAADHGGYDQPMALTGDRDE